MNNNIFNLFGGYSGFINRFNSMKQQLSQQNISPQEKVQQLLNSGQMTQQQFEKLRGIANQITGQNL